jgi:hypothetical protein
MSDIDKLNQDLEEFKKITKSEIPFKDIKKWMINELGVEEIKTGKGKKKGKGSIRFFRHPAFLEINEHGHFTVHVLHKKREMILRVNLKNELIPKLEFILEYLRKMEA